jgi:hypothetical protein
LCCEEYNHSQNGGLFQSLFQQNLFWTSLADVHLWSVYLTQKIATCNEFYKKRLVGVRDKPLKIEPLAKAVVDDIIAGNKESENLKWYPDGRVRVNIGNIILQTCQQTMTSRRKRFRNKVEELLLAHDWHPVGGGYNVYKKKS